MRMELYHSLACLILFLATMFNLAGSELPIVFIQTGSCSFLRYTLLQATRFNKKVILLGDRVGQKFPEVAGYDINQYSTSAKDFARIYLRPEDKSSNRYRFELFCVQRWFILRDFMRKHALKHVFCCDSDVLLFCNVGEKYALYHNADVVLMRRSGSLDGVNNAFFCSPGHVYWKYEALDAFCHYITDCYTQNLPFFKKEYFDRGHFFSDMSLSTLFVISGARGHTVQFLNEPINRECFDTFLLHDGDGRFELYEEPLSHMRVKKLYWLDGIPRCFDIKERCMTKLCCLHCAGPAKKLIRLYHELSENQRAPKRGVLICPITRGFCRDELQLSDFVR